MWFFVGIAIAVAFGIALAPYILRLTAYAVEAAMLIGFVLLPIGGIYLLWVGLQWSKTGQAEPLMVSVGFIILVATVLFWIWTLYEKIKNTTWQQLIEEAKLSVRKLGKVVWQVTKYTFLAIATIAAWALLLDITVSRGNGVFLRLASSVGLLTIAGTTIWFAVKFRQKK